MLNERFEATDFSRAKRDILPFIKDHRAVELWSEDFFASVTKDKLKIK